MEAKNLIAALVKAQKEFEIPTKSGVNPQFKSKYAKLDDIYHACRTALANNGLVLTHSVQKEEESFFLVTTLYHVSGESIQNKFPMLIEKHSNQGIGSARTYACKYATASLLALPSDEDDDGNMSASALNMKSEEVRRAKPEPTFTQEQIDEVLELIGEDTDLMGRILKGYGVGSFHQIPQKNFTSIVKNLNKRLEHVS